MKKVFFFIVPILFLISCVEENTGWQNESRSLISYDSYGNLVNTIIQDWKKDKWLNRTKTSFKYDEFGNEIEELSLYRDNGEWVNEKLIKSEYNPDNKISSQIKSDWKYEKWVEGYKYIYSYEDKLKRIVISHYRNLDDDWVLVNKNFKQFDVFRNEVESWYQSIKSFYDEQGGLHYAGELQKASNKWVNKVDSLGNIIDEQYQYVNDGIVHIIARTTIDFNSENQIVSKLKQKKEIGSLENKKLVNVSKTQIFYNEFGKESEIQSIWENSKWEKSNQHTFINNEDGLLEKMLYKELKNNVWVNKFRTLFKYDEDGNKIESIIQKYKID